VVGDDEIQEDPINYEPEPLEVERFSNSNGIGVEAPSNKFGIQGQGVNAWHYQANDVEDDDEEEEEPLMVMVKAPKTDLPTNLRYKVFFYNACFSGRSYIENFKDNREFIFTNDYCWVDLGAEVFVQGVVEGMSPNQIVPLLNNGEIHGGEDEEPHL
jgi:hypothetical protein